MEQRDPQVASVKLSDADVAVVVKHLEESFKHTPFDQSLRKLSSLARGESTVEYFERDQQGSGWLFLITLVAYHLVRMTTSKQIKACFVIRASRFLLENAVIQLNSNVIFVRSQPSVYSSGK